MLCYGMVGYIWCFLGALAIDSIPVFAPPAWTLVVFLVLHFKLNAWVATALAAVGSTIGRFALSKFMPKIASKMLSAHENSNITFLGKKLGGRFWPAFSFVLVYSLTPLSTTALFTAAGAARINPLPILPAFLIGKFGSDALMVVGGKHAIHSIKDVFKGQASPQAIIVSVLGFLLITAVLFVDWKAMLQHKKLRLDFKIWKTHERG